MGLFSKVKDILFEEEEVTKPIKINEEPVAKRIERPLQNNEIKVEQIKDNNEIKKSDVKSEPVIEIDSFNGRDLFSDNSFPFQEFDEEEFTKSFGREPAPKVNQKARSTNVLDYERNKKNEKRREFGRVERNEIKETNEKKKFKPSPIISPVYGILNEDYRIEDIKNREEDDYNLNIEEVRKKAFEPEMLQPEEKYMTDDTVTVKIQQPEEEKIQKVKTIDDLLEDTSDEIIDILPTRNKDTNIKYDDVELKPDKEDKDVSFEEDDTLENDLFDLIDSMYEQREDGDF